VLLLLALGVVLMVRDTINLGIVQQMLWTLYFPPWNWELGKSLSSWS
jgi:hypothetical protein